MSDLVQTLHAIGKLYDRELIALLLTVPRIYAFLAASQLFNTSSVPRLARTACILVLAMVATPMNIVQADGFDRNAFTYVGYFAKEYAIGFVLGYMVGWVFWAVQSAGAFIDNQRGASIAASIDPLQGEESPLMGILFSQVFLTYTFTTGSILTLFGLLYKSYLLWPASRALPVLSDAFPTLILQLADHALRFAVVLAGPIVAVMFLAEFALAIVSRFSPQVQVFVLAMPIKSALAILMLVFYFGILLAAANDELGGVGKLVQTLFAMDQINDTGLAHPPVSPKAP